MNPKYSIRIYDGPLVTFTKIPADLSGSNIVFPLVQPKKNKTKLNLSLSKI